MDESKRTNKDLSEAGWYIRHVGVAVCIASIVLALRSKTGGLVYVILFLVCLAILAGVSIFYFIARRVSERWRSKAVRSYFSPYIVGTTIWFLLIVLLAVLYRL